MAKKIRVEKVKSEICYVFEEMEVDESDLMTIADAAKLRQVSISSVARMMDIGTLPAFQIPGTAIAGAKAKRFTSRKAVLALGKESGEGRDEPTFKDGFKPHYVQHERREKAAVPA